MGPKGKAFVVNGSLTKFCQVHNLSRNALKAYINNGQVPPLTQMSSISRNKKNNTLQIRNNTIG